MEDETDSRLLNTLRNEPEWTKRPLFAYLFKHSSVIILCIFLFALYGLFLSHPIDLTTADIGRHIKNGEILFQDASVLRINFYSYTEPDFPVINHHWGSGLLLYWTYVLFGFTGVQLFFILLSFAALFIFLKTAKLYSSWGIVGLSAIPAVFLLAERTEIRPEVFSYLFAGLFFYILCRYRESYHPHGCNRLPSEVSSSWKSRCPWYGDPEKELDSRLRGNDKKNAKLLWLLPPIQIFWVNAHIYFLLGPLILGAFLLESLFLYRERFTKLFLIFCSVSVALLVNPYGYKAITATITIFKNYGYRLAENQPVWFMEKLMSDPSFLIFKIVFGVCVLVVITVLLRKWRSLRLAHLFVFAGISIMAWFSIRNIALFGLFAIPFLSLHIQTLITNQKIENLLTQIAIYTVAIALLVTTVFGFPKYFPYWHSFGFGLEEGNSGSINFIQANHIAGPFFNNYDIGGYLIFHLFPEKRVFVDNRPEAYPSEFFQKTYIPMQEDASVWKEKLAKYNFNAIVFSYHDATPWGQHFLVERVQDPEWAPIYVDGRVLILIKNKKENEPLIARFKLPSNTFRLQK